MKRRLGSVLFLFLVVNSTGCVLLDIIKIPLQLFFSIVGGAAGFVGLTDVRPSPEPPPIVRNVGGEQWLVTGLAPDVPCKITCSAPGFAPRTYAWPDDFGGRGGEVAVRLDRAK